MAKLNLSRNAQEFNLKSLTSRVPETNSRMMFSESPSMENKSQLDSPAQETSDLLKKRHSEVDKL